MHAYKTNAFFVAKTAAYRRDLNNGVSEIGTYTGDPCIYGVFDANTNKYIIAMEEINRYTPTTTTTSTTTTTTTTTIAPTTTTTSTTTSTTSTTSTTTIPLLGYAYVDIFNDNSVKSITNITVNGVQVDGVVFPIVAGDGASATTTQTGSSRTIVVSYTNGTGNYVIVTDTTPVTNCANTTGTSRTFAGQVVSDGGTVFIEMGDGSCP